MKLVLAGVATALIMSATACVTAPQRHEVIKTSSAPQTYDATWSALVALAGARSWPIVTIEKASGIMATDWLEIPREYADCGDSPLANESPTLVRINMVARATERATTVTVNATFRIARTFGQYSRVINCTSTDELEKAIHSYLACATPIKNSAVEQCIDIHETSTFDDGRRWCFDAPGGQRCARSPDACEKAHRLSSMARSECKESGDPKAQ
jgi:hypothetical protein